MIRQRAVLSRGGKNAVREHAAPTRLPLDGGRGAPRGGDNPPGMGGTFGLTNVVRCRTFSARVSIAAPAEGIVFESSIKSGWSPSLIVRDLCARTGLNQSPARSVAGRTGGCPPKLTDDDIEAAKAMLANPGIGVTQIATASASLRRRSIATSPPRDPRIPRAFDLSSFLGDAANRDPHWAGTAQRPKPDRTADPRAVRSFRRWDAGRKVAKPGDVVRVKVLEVEPKRRRISLTMRMARRSPPRRVTWFEPEKQRPTSNVDSMIARCASTAANPSPER
jgi:hypothetical protein